MRMQVNADRPSAWRWFPAALIGTMGVVLIVNIGMVVTAVRGFPGAAGTDGFDLSNDYGRVLAATAHQSALGWQIAIELDSERRPVLRLADRVGASLASPVIAMHAERPIGPAEPRALDLEAADKKFFRSTTALGPGQWDLMVTIRSGKNVASLTRRVVVR